MAEKKESLNLQDAISSDQISRSSDSNAAEALRRITGVSIQDGKFPVVRGLGDRYTNTQVNNAPIPSPEPDKRTVPLDLFPAALLENITASKIFTPDLPGTFAGGSLNIKTRAYPDKRVLNLKFAVKQNTNWIGDNIFIYTGDKGQNDFWGFDDGTRDIPDLPDYVIRKEADSTWYEFVDGKLVIHNVYSDTSIKTRDEWMDVLSDYARDMGTGYTYQKHSMNQPFSLNVNYRNKISYNDVIEHGFFLNSSFSNGYKYKDMSSKIFLSELSTLEDRNILESGYNTNLANSVSTGFNYYDLHKVKLQYLYTHTSSNNISYATGSTQNVDNGIFIKYHYIEKVINNVSLSGVTDVDYTGNHLIEWNLTGGVSERYEPDTRRHNYIVSENDNGGFTYKVMRSSSEAGQRDFIYGDDNNLNFDLNYTYSFAIALNLPIKFKMGTRNQKNHETFSNVHFIWINHKTGLEKTSFLMMNLVPSSMMKTYFNTSGPIPSQKD